MSKRYLFHIQFSGTVDILADSKEEAEELFYVGNVMAPEDYDIISMEAEPNE